MKRPRSKRRPHFAAMAGGGRVVHVVNADGDNACGSKVYADFRLHARITCPGCMKRRPDLVKAWGKRRLYRRVPWKMIDASYEPIRQALDRTTARLGLRLAPLAKKNRIVDLTKQQGAAS